MSQSARVHSIDALQDFRVTLTTFSHEATQALDLVNVEINRMVEWLTHDQLKYWISEVRRREDAVNEARMELSRCLISTTSTGDTPACTDQKKALEKARNRLREAEEKVDKVKHWTQVVQQEIIDYRGPAQQLTNLLDATLPSGCAMLDRMLSILESYVSMSPSDAASKMVESMAQKGTDAADTAADSTAADAPADPKAKGA